MIKFRLISATAGEMTFADPNDITHTLRIKVSSSPKTAGSVSLTNVRYEAIEAYKNPVSDGSNTGLDGIAIRSVISGSTMSEAKTVALAAQHQANVMSCLNDAAMKGFVPSVDMIVSPT